MPIGDFWNCCCDWHHLLQHCSCLQCNATIFNDWADFWMISWRMHRWCNRASSLGTLPIKAKCGATTAETTQERLVPSWKVGECGDGSDGSGRWDALFWRSNSMPYIFTQDFSWFLKSWSWEFTARYSFLKRYFDFWRARMHESGHLQEEFLFQHGTMSAKKFQFSFRASPAQKNP